MLLKNKQRIIGILIIIFSYGYIAFRLSRINFNFSTIEIDNSRLVLLLITVSLSFINIFIEALKWKTLLTPFYTVKLNHSIKMIFAGFSTGIFTPAKLGEPYGRIIFLPKQQWTIGTILNYLGGSFQNIIILLWGFTFLIFISVSNDHQYINIIKYSSFIFLSTLIVFIILYLKRNSIYVILSKFSWSKKILESISAVQQIPLKTYLLVFSLSATRYLIYCIQLILLLNIFSINSLSYSCILWIPIYFMFITAIPSFLLADLGIRNSVAIFLFAPFFINETNIMLSVSILWLVNHVLPAIIGSLYIAKNN